MSPAAFTRLASCCGSVLGAAVFVLGCAHRGSEAVGHRREAPSIAKPADLGSVVVDAARFGARGDDDVDDTAAIQAALTSALASPGAQVRLGSGTFHLSDVAPHDQVCLQIVGARGLWLQGAGVGATRLVLRSKPDAHMLAIARSEGVRVTHLSLDGTRGDRRGTHGIRVAESTDVALSSLEVRSMAHYGIGLQAGAMRRIRIEGVRIDDTGGDGLDFKNTAAQNDEIVIQNLRVSRPGQTSPRQAGVDIRGRARLSNVEVTQVPAGATGIRFREDGPATGPGGHGSSLAGFSVTGAPGSLGVAIAADDVRVGEGTITGVDTGVNVRGDRAHISSVLVRGARYAFRIEGSAERTWLQACRGESSRAGVWVEGSWTHISGSTFQGNERCGICLRPGATSSRFADNDLSGNGAPVDDESGGAVE